MTPDPSYLLRARLRSMCRELSRQRTGLVASFVLNPAGVYCRYYPRWGRVPFVHLVPVTGPDHWGVLDEWWAAAEVSLMDRPSFASRSGSTGPVPVTGTLTEFPRLLEHLTSLSYSDGTPRQTSSLLIFADPMAGLKCCLKDRQEGYACWVSGHSLEDLLLSLETCIDSGDPSHWRLDRGPDQATANRAKGGGRVR